jgi:methylase of polypeptide subunit release factors
MTPAALFGEPAGCATDTEAGVLGSCYVQEVCFESECLYALIAPSVHQPDVWTDMLLRGVRWALSLASISPRLFVEIGVGTGVVGMFLAKWVTEPSRMTYIGLDINAAACECARLNLGLSGTRFPYRIVASAALLRDLPRDAQGQVDLLAANLPQVPDRDCTNRNDYYPTPAFAGEEDELDRCGLGLLREMLRQSKNVLAADGRLVFTLAKRCPQAHIDAMFDAVEVDYEIVARRRVAQDPTTSIESFARVETGLSEQFRFFACPNVDEAIGAREAKRVIDRGGHVYYDLDVAVARPQTSSSKVMDSADATALRQS